MDAFLLFEGCFGLFEAFVGRGGFIAQLRVMARPLWEGEARNHQFLLLVRWPSILEHNIPSCGCRGPFKILEQSHMVGQSLFTRKSFQILDRMQPRWLVWTSFQIQGLLPSGWGGKVGRGGEVNGGWWWSLIRYLVFYYYGKLIWWWRWSAR